MNGNLPLSNAKYLQDKTPGYLYVEVVGDTVTFSYYNLDDHADTPYDTYTVRKVEIATYTVTFDADNGTGNITVTVETDKKVTQPENPIKEGFTFKGWFADEIEFDFDTAINADLILTAKWSPVPISYMQIASVQGAAAPSAITVMRNSTVQLSCNVNPDALPVGIVWTVSNSSYATVNPETGTVSIKNLAGTVVLTATAPSGVSQSIVLRIV